MASTHATRGGSRMGSIIALAAAIAGLALFTTAGNAHAASATKYQSSKVVHSTPKQVAKLNRLIRAGSFDAIAAQSTTTLTVAYGCDQYSAFVSASDHEIASWLNTSGGYGYLASRFATRRSPTWLKCELTLASANRTPIWGCDSTVEIAGTDANVTGWTITYRRCFA